MATRRREHEVRTRALSNGGRLLLAAVTVLGVGTAAASAPGGTRRVEGDAARGRVTYFSRACASDNTPNRTPVTAGELILRRGGARKIVELGAGGAFSVDLPGSGVVHADLILRNPRVDVVETRPSSTPGEVQNAFSWLVPLQPDFNPAEGPIVLSPGRHADVPNGAINIMEVLDRGAQIANKARGAKLPKITAQFFDDKNVAGRPTLHYEEPNVMVVGRFSGGPGGGPTPAEWEPVGLLHEYGHHLQKHTADPNEPPDVTHSLTDVFPKQPAVPWAEGFASAFAAIVLETGNLTVDCGKQYQNLMTTPARPMLKGPDRRFAQYNETRTAAITWRVMTKLGGKAPAAGLAKLLTVLKTYKRDGKPAQSTRDLRDAIAMNLEKKKADQVAYDEIFQRQGVSWWRQFEARLPAAILVPPLPPGVSIPVTGLGLSQAVVELQLRVEGPGGFDCRLKTDTGPNDTKGQLDSGNPLPLLRDAASGGLAFSNNDDCWLGGGDGTPGTTLPGVTPPGGQLLQGPIGGTVILPFPYLPNLRHWDGLYRVIAKYVCKVQPITLPAPAAPPNCPKEVPVTLNEDAQVDDPSAHLTSTFKLLLGVDIPLLTFEAQGGKCRLADQGGPIDCSI